ncbi:cobalamin biosynthesis protein [Amycolatopsis sp. NPDC088138]|uniref:cobalamin biosynthesis protein n=1 Tax=Amycolatopsis sp. NPDC088138 TaxID=3363938 RepID=UPI00382D7443
MPLRLGTTAAGLVTGYVADALFGDPRQGHPVAIFGTAATRLERRMWADSKPRGAVYAGLCAFAAVGLGVALQTATRRRPFARFAATAVCTWVVLGGRGLADEGAEMAKLLEAGEVPSARQRLSHLCARDATTLDSAELARAATESIAENTSDAVVAPLFWGAVAGLPGLLGYRALNTLDAMVGYRSPRYREFGWAAARADDLVNLAPSRLGAALTALCAPLAGGRSRAAWRVWRRDGGLHPSPNAGQVEAAFAGALDIRLGGTNSYGGEVERRARLGEGRDPEPVDLRRAVRLSRLVGLAAVVVAAVAAPTTPWGAAPVQSIGVAAGGRAARRSVDNSAGARPAVDNSGGTR